MYSFYWTNLEKGGGISVNLHHNGRIEDFINNEECGFSPERAEGLQMFDLVSMCYKEGMAQKKVMKILKTQGGLVVHLGTTSCEEIENRIERGCKKAEVIYDSMTLNVAKNIVKKAPGVCGKVDAIIITGGIAHSDYISYIRQCVEFIAPVVIYPGEDEMQTLANGALRVLNGEEIALNYIKTDDPID